MDLAQGQGRAQRSGSLNTLISVLGIAGGRCFIGWVYPMSVVGTSASACESGTLVEHGVTIYQYGVHYVLCESAWKVQFQYSVESRRGTY